MAPRAAALRRGRGVRVKLTPYKRPLLRPCTTPHTAKLSVQRCGCNPAWDGIDTRLRTGEIGLTGARVALDLPAVGDYSVFGQDPDRRSRKTAATKARMATATATAEAA